MAAKSKLNYREAFSELSEVLSQMQGEDVDVDELTAKVQRATELITFCRDKIKSTELEIKKIIKDFEQEYKQDLSE